MLLEVTHLTVRYDRAMIIVEHKLQQLMKIVDRIIVLDFGTVIADGKPEEIVTNKKVIEAYLGEREM